MRRSLLLLTAIIALGVVAVLVVTFRNDGREEQAERPATEETRQQSIASSVAPITVLVPSPTPFATVAATLDTGRSDVARQLVQSLSEVNTESGQLTPESAEQWHRNLLDLVGQGSAAVPAVREFLQRNQDLRFETGSAPNLLGEPTLRIALLKVLFDLPAPENVILQAQILQTTTEPEEIALLARQLQMQQPGKFRELVLANAKVALARAQSGQLPGRDTSALAKVLESYANPETVRSVAAPSAHPVEVRPTAVPMQTSTPQSAPAPILAPTPVPTPTPLHLSYTATLDGWGALPSDNTAGTLLQNTFLAIYPGGSVQIGGGYFAKYQSAGAVRNFVLSKGAPAALTKNYTNPTADALNNTFAAQVLALRLNVDFSKAGKLPPGLEVMKLRSTKLVDLSVLDVLSLANLVLGGDTAPGGWSVAEINTAVTMINENFENGGNRGNLNP